MSLYPPVLQDLEKREPLAEHPWANRIKYVFSNNYKHAHNSIRNPVHSKKKKILANDMIKFTIIGDRVTEEFIYCVKLVTGLYTYRKKLFHAPEIRGVSTVEWPEVWNSLKIMFGGFSYCLRSSVAVLFNDKYLGGEQELKELVESKYQYYLKIDYYKEAIAEFARFIRSCGRPCAFMHVSVNDEHIGTLIFMLYSDVVPYTCENFLRLCNTRRGGYSGTPIHRIVKDGWIQAGGYGLKETDLNCENFIVPNDRRGVLGMANAGRHIQCSTQFYILLQPSSWMDRKFVAFGQLIEGSRTLERIESIPTWYESPTSTITIYQAGIFNMDCQGIIVQPSTKEYINDHIEDLNSLKEMLHEIILERVYLTAKLREIERLRELYGEAEEEAEEESDAAASVRATKRFNRKKEDIEKQYLSSKETNRPPSGSQASPITRQPAKTPVSENNDFDVESYNPEDEELDYKHASIASTPSLVVKPTIPYYIPLTDVKYPGEKPSAYDLKKFLRGDYCLESDLKELKDLRCPNEPVIIPVDVFDLGEDVIDDSDEFDSEEERELNRYFAKKWDSVSFTGPTIKGMATTITKPRDLKTIWESSRISDDELRRWRIAEAELRAALLRNMSKRVSLNIPLHGEHRKIKRRQTGFPGPDDLAKLEHIRSFSMQDFQHNSDDDDKEDTSRTNYGRSSAESKERRHTTDNDEDDDERRTKTKSILGRLYSEVGWHPEPPTLKDYKPIGEKQQKHGWRLLTASNHGLNDLQRETYHHSPATGKESIQRALNLQHGQRIFRKISSDYVKTIDHMEHNLKNSLRSVEYAKSRPALSVAAYQEKNKQYQDVVKRGSVSSSKEPETTDGGKNKT